MNHPFLGVIFVVKKRQVEEALDLLANYCPFSISAIFFLHCFLQFSSTLKGNKLWYKGFPDNMVLIRMVPGLARIPLFNTVFIRKCHFLPHKTQIKPPNISACDTYMKIIGFQNTSIDFAYIS